MSYSLSLLLKGNQNKTKEVAKPLRDELEEENWGGIFVLFCFEFYFFRHINKYGVIEFYLIRFLHTCFLQAVWRQAFKKEKQKKPHLLPL